MTYAWTIVPDTTAPETTLHSGPEATTIETDATFVFSSNELEAEFECSLDGEAFGGCETPDIYTELAVGTHTYEVRAIDLAGNVDQTPARHDVDDQPPARHDRSRDDDPDRPARRDDRRRRLLHLLRHRQP